MLIGNTSPLPDPTDIDPLEYSGWYIESNDPTVPDAFYKLQDVNGVQSWVRWDGRIHNYDDPVLPADQQPLELQDYIGNLIQSQSETFEYLSKNMAGYLFNETVDDASGGRSMSRLRSNQ